MLTYRPIAMRRFLLCLALLSFVCCKSRPEEVWIYKTGGILYASPVFTHGLVIVGSSDSFLYAFEPKTGNVRWKTHLGGRVMSQALVQGEFLYVGGGSDFYCLQASDGKIIWKFRTNAGYIHYDACGDEEGIYFGAGDHNFYKLGKDGKPLWHVPTQNKFTGFCDFYQNLVFTAAWDNHYYAVDRATGAIVWKVPTGEINYGGPAVVNDRVFFATHEKLYVFDAASGKILNQEKTTELINVIAYKNHVWTNEEGLAKRDLNGTMVQELRFPALLRARVFVKDGLFIVSGGLQNLLGISEDLKIVWEYETDEAFWDAGVLHDNIYYAANRNGSVYALRIPRP